MKNNIDHLFERLHGRKKALIAYLSAGYPSFGTQKNHIRALIEGGVDMLELGVPFSDPVADGPTIQYASHKSLLNGTTLDKIISWVAAFPELKSIPTVFMSYLNPILSYGVKSFAADAARAGIQGLIIPDAIPEETEEIGWELKSKGLHLIHLVAPTSSLERQHMIARRTGGFLYAVSVAGVTGARKGLPVETKSWLGKLKRLSSAPVCVGFGISGPQQIRRLKSNVDGFIVGSAIIDVIRKSEPAQTASRLREFAESLSKECRHGR